MSERARKALEELQRMAAEGVLDLDRIVDLNKSVDEDLLQQAMRALKVDTRTEAINRSLRIALDAAGRSDS
jgi:Arc/MetJ family transcription regulator